MVAPAFSAAMKMARPPAGYPSDWLDGGPAFGRTTARRWAVASRWRRDATPLARCCMRTFAIGHRASRAWRGSFMRSDIPCGSLGFGAPAAGRGELCRCRCRWLRRQPVYARRLQLRGRRRAQLRGPLRRIRDDQCHARVCAGDLQGNAQAARSLPAHTGTRVVDQGLTVSRP